MAEALKNQFGPAIPHRIADSVALHYPKFNQQAFVNDVLEGFEPLDLMARARKIAIALHRHLPPDYAKAAEILIASLGPKLEATSGWGMAPFFYLPHSFFIAEFGLGHFELSMRAQYELTQRFTAEFSIRPYLEHHTDATLETLRSWVQDPSVHVRRLVSEGTRPRLPWAPRLRRFQTDPGPVLALLELLKDDSEAYVRRSVANNLNDIGKDHPDLLVETCRRWLDGASQQQRQMVRHALRTEVKSSSSKALALLGYVEDQKTEIKNITLAPQQARTGGVLRIMFDLVNPTTVPHKVLAYLKVSYPKLNGKLSPKVFKLKSLKLSPGETRRLEKQISFAPMTTRRHYPGRHPVEALLNGKSYPLGDFELLPD